MSGTRVKSAVPLVVVASVALLAFSSGCTSECFFDTDCEGADLCMDGVCATPSMSQLGQGMCESHDDCSPRERCRANVCEKVTASCTSDDDCDGDMVCEDGDCVDPSNGSDDCPRPPAPDPCDGHDAPCPCVAGDYRFLPQSGCSGLNPAGVTVWQDECDIGFVFGSFNLDGRVTSDGEMNLADGLFSCTATGVAGDDTIELDCQGCVILCEPFLPPLPSVEIPTGTFMMGSDDPAAEDHEGPLHEVSLSCFRIDTVEVTHRHYYECVYQPHDRLATLCRLPPGFTEPEELLHPDVADRPVRGVSHADAQRFCDLRSAGLPTEAQWERAARGDADARAWPWGDDPGGACAYDHFEGCSPDRPISADHFSATSPFGVKNMAGNVRNWVRDAWSETIYEERASEGVVEDPSGPSFAGNPLRVIRGGSYLFPVEESQVYRRRAGAATEPDPEEIQDVGFRCAR